MEPNPYEAPKEGGHLTRRTGVAIGVWMALLIPSAFICGGITCYATGVAGEASADAFGYGQNANVREAGWWLGIPLWILVTALIPLVAYLYIVRRRVNR